MRSLEADLGESGPYLPVLMIDHNVMRFDVSVHDAFAVAEVQGLEEFVDVKSNIEIVELGIEAPEIDIVDILENERRGLTLQRAEGFRVSAFAF